MILCFLQIHQCKLNVCLEMVARGITETSAIAVIWNKSCKKKNAYNFGLFCFVFLIVIISASRTCNFFFFLVSGLSYKSLSYWWVAPVLGHLETNHSKLSILFVSCSSHYDRGLIVVIVYYFQIWNLKEHIIISSRVINSPMGPIYIKTSFISNKMLPSPH